MLSELEKDGSKTYTQSVHYSIVLILVTTHNLAIRGVCRPTSDIPPAVDPGLRCI
jgi:hypothetical protein